VKRLSGRARQQRNARILAASNTCHICGQPGADAIDHVIPLARGGTEAASNLKPAHHDVPPFCNRIKSDKDYAPIVRRSNTLA
jgi:5-methylcytosine-specific restriction endonuclease McrA